jgi:hypothetical protein
MYPEVELQLVQFVDFIEQVKQLLLHFKLDINKI